MNTKRIAATLTLAAGMTMLGGMTTQADTTSAANKVPASVANITPANTTFAGTIGPFPTRWLCNFHRNNVGPSGGDCYQGGGGGWYYKSI